MKKNYNNYKNLILSIFFMIVFIGLKFVGEGYIISSTLRMLYIFVYAIPFGLSFVYFYYFRKNVKESNRKYVYLFLFFFELIVAFTLLGVFVAGLNFVSSLLIMFLSFLMTIVFLVLALINLYKYFEDFKF
jgi:hypothetical protein